METPDITDHQVVNVVLTSADLVRGAEAKREKVKETLLNILEGRSAKRRCSSVSTKFASAKLFIDVPL